MNPGVDTTWNLLVWNSTGTLLAQEEFARRTVAVSADEDADLSVAELSGATAFVSFDGVEGTLLYESAGGDSVKYPFWPGRMLAVGGISWLITVPAEHRAARSVKELLRDEGEAAATLFLERMLTWIAKPMAGTFELRRNLREFLSIVVSHGGARSGMLVCTERDGFALVAVQGLAEKEAQDLWEQMPPNLTTEIIRSQARLLLPEAFRQRTGHETTLFVKGVKSVAGFPIIAEGRLIAVFYLGFENLIKDLTASNQALLETAADLLGLVMQRAMLRDELSGLKLRTDDDRGQDTETAAVRPAQRMMVGNSPAIRQIYKMIARLAPVDVTALIRGETGTGKELVAKELHRGSPRRSKPFVVVNAAALPESLAESELFGHKKGAFTGALSDRAGLVEQAAGGTLFLDEIGELALPIQAKLLRVLQERKVTRLGDNLERPVNFRLLSATHRDLAAMVKAGTFREDLFYRIAGAEITIPPLRERQDDILLLAETFKRQFAERHGLADKDWSPDALAALLAHPWSGNVRELENLVARAFIMAEGPVIKGHDLGFSTLEGMGAASNIDHEPLSVERKDPITLNEARDAWMRSYLVDALRRTNGRRADTARVLGIGERTLFRYLEQYEIRDI